MVFKLTPETAVSYLRSTKRLPAGSASGAGTSAHGGRSNRVVKIVHDEGCVVLKQPRHRLADAADTPADPARVHREAATLRIFGRLAEATDVSVTVPAVQFEDHDAHVIGLECAPPETTWRADLLANRVDPSVAADLGGFLATVHAAAASDDGLREMISKNDVFERFRLQRYHRPVAEQHPDIAALIETEMDLLRSTATTLIHGDFNPKNVLIDSEGGSRAWIFDTEFACWGHPVWDVASMLAHIYIPAIQVREDYEAYLKAASSFWYAYKERVPWSIEPVTVTESAILLLARVDGDATLGYLSERAKTVLRTVGHNCLVKDIQSVGVLNTRIRAACD